jgi:uncharacterized protein YbjT (DUF2867 family)
MKDKSYLVIGASGKTGSRVAKMLMDSNMPVKLASRSSDITFNWNDVSNWPKVLSNVKAMYVTYFPDLALPQAPKDIEVLCRIALQQGVKHITLLSGRGEEVARECEQIVQHSGLSWTIIRASWFAQNFSEGLFHQLLTSNTVELPVGDVKEPFIDIDDISEIAYESLIEPRHKNELYEVTGPELLSFADVIESVNEMFDKQVRFQQVSISDFCINMAKVGIEPPTIEMLQYLFCHVLDGRNEYVTNDVHRALGRNARSFNEFLTRNDMFFSKPVKFAGLI